MVILLTSASCSAGQERSNAATRSVRAYRSEGHTFSSGASAETLKVGEAVWRVTDDALVGPKGETLARLPGHIAYAFAWTGYFGSTGELAPGANVAQ